MARYRLTKDKLSFEEYRAKHAAEKANNTNKLPGLDLGNAVAVTTSTVEQPTSYSHGGGGARRDAAHLKQREDERMAEYESIPNYNIVERAADNIGRSVNSIVNPGGGRGSDSKSEQYAKKTELADRYTQIVNKRAGEALANYEPQSDDTLPQLLGQNYSKLTSPVQYRNAMAEITPYLEQYGITPKQLENYIKTQTYAEQNAKMAEYTKEHPFLANVAEVPISVGQSLNVLPSILSYVQGKPIAENTALSELDKLPGTIMGTTGQAIEDNAKTELGGKAGRLAYDVGMGVADNLFRIAATGGSSVGSRLLGAGKAAAGSLANNMDKNTSDAQKVLTSTAAGIISYMTEKAPTENLINNFLTTGSKEASKNFWLNFGKMVAKQAGAEGTEELVEGLANTATDLFVNKSESDYAKSVQNYISQGMSRDAARNKAANDIAMETAYEALVGALSGGLMGGGESVINNMAYNASRFAPEIDQNYEQYQRNYQGSGNGSVDNAMVGTLDNANELMANNAVSVDDLLNNPYLFNAGRNLGVDESGRLVNQFVAPWTNGVNMNWNEGYLDDGSAELNSNNMRNAMAEDNGRTIPFLDNTDADSDLRRSMNRALELNEGRRMINPYMDSAMDALDAEISEDNALRMNAEEDGRTIRNPYLNWNNGEGQGYQQVTNFENIPQININWNDGSANNTQNLSAELQTAQNQVARFMDQYRTTGNELYRNIADSIQQRINNELGKNAQNSANELTQKAQNAPNSELNGQKSADEAEWARLMAMAPGEVAAQNEQENAPFLQTQKPKKNSQQRSQVMAEDIGLNPRTQMDDAKVTESDNKVTLTQNVMPNGVSDVATNTFGSNMEEFQTPEGSDLLMEGIQQGLFNKSNLNERNYGQDVMSNEWLDSESDKLLANPQVLEERVRNGEAIYDRVVLKAAMKTIKNAINNKDMDTARYYALKTASSGNNAGSILNVFAQEADRNIETAMAKTDALIRDANERYFKKHKSQREGCSRLAQALRNIGNDYTNIKTKQIPTFDKIRAGVEAELNRESSSISDIFNEQDKAYIANMVQKGLDAKELQLKLEQRLTTGNWDISDADLEAANALLEEARQYDDNSKKAAELDAQACAILAKYLPNSSFYEKWNAWRYLAMLGNPRTHMRNMIGNFAFGQILETASDKVGAILEGVGQAVGAIDKDQRSKSLKTASAKFKNRAEQYLEDHSWTDLTDEGNKYSNLKKGIEGQKKVFGDKNAFQRGLSKVNDFASGALTQEDVIALKQKYRQAMTNFLLSRGYDESVFDATDEKSKAAVEQADAYAIRRAKEATFHEDSKFANAWNNASKNFHESDSWAANAVGYGMDSLMPFVKTPANVLKMGIRYTPANVLNAIYNSKNKKPTQAIEEIARAMTGTAIIGLGMFLKSHGILRTRGKEEEKQLDKVTKQQDFSVNVNGNSYTLDWLSPAAVPLFIGAELYQEFVENEGFDVGKVLEAVADPVTEMSMLQGINNTIDSIAKNRQEETPAGQLAADIGFGYLSQGIPTLFGQVARTIDNTRRNSYYTGKEGTADQFEQYGKKAMAKTPGLTSKLQPFVNAWGEEETNSVENPFLRLALNTLSPGYYADTTADATESELYRLNKDTNGGAKNVLPTLAKATPVNGEGKLSAEDYTLWAKTEGQNLKALDDATISSPRYQSLDDQGKIDLLNDVRKFSNALSLNQFTDAAQDYGYEYNIEEKNDYKKQYEAYQYKGAEGLIDYLSAINAVTDAQKAAGHASKTKADRINGLDSMENMSVEDKAAYLKIMDDYTKKGQYVEKFLGPKYAYDWYRVEALGGSKKDEKLAYIYMSDLPSTEKEVLESVLDMSDEEIKTYLNLGK